MCMTEKINMNHKSQKPTKELGLMTRLITVTFQGLTDLIKNLHIDIQVMKHERKHHIGTTRKENG